MGPRLCSRGEGDRRPGGHRGDAVAMGPRLCSRGEAMDRLECAETQYVSQWGHGFVAVERLWTAWSVQRPSTCRNGATAL